MKLKNVLVTGSSRGIGKAIALAFAKKGYAVGINCMNQAEAMLEVKEEIETLGVPCLAYQADVGNYQQASDMMNDFICSMGGISILINNAGIASVGLFQSMSYQEYHSLIQTNLFSVLNCCHQAVPAMVRQQYGKIINISSIWGNAGASCEAVYSAAKGAVNSFTRALGKELGPSNIQVNAIACGIIDTDMNRCFSKEELDALTEDIPAGRFGKASEVASLAFEIANGHDYLNGQVITLDGGYL